MKVIITFPLVAGLGHGANYLLYFIFLLLNTFLTGGREAVKINKKEWKGKSHMLENVPGVTTHPVLF